MYISMKKGEINVREIRKEGRKKKKRNRRQNKVR